MLEVGLGNALAIVKHRNGHPLGVPNQIHANGAAFAGVFDGVVQQDHHQLLDAIRVGHHARAILNGVRPGKIAVLFPRDVRIALANVQQQLADIQRMHFHGDRARLQAGKLHQIVDQAGKAQHFAQDDVVIPLAGILVPHHTVAQRLNQAAHGGERRAQFVGNVGHIIAPRAL